MYPGHARTSTRWVNRRAMATVSSVLCESTTTISSAQATDAKASAMSAASFLVMTVTETGGTRAEVYSGSLRAGGAWGLGLAMRLEAEACGLRLEADADSQERAAVAPDCRPWSLLPNDQRAAGRDRAGSGRGDAAEAAADRHFLHRLEVDERLVVVGDRLDFDDARDREVALCLEHEEGRRHAGSELLLLGFELLLLQFARGARRLDALLVRLHVARDRAHLRGDLQLDVLHLHLGFLVLQLDAREICLRRAGADRVAELHADRPLRIRAAEHVAEHGAVAALGENRAVRREAAGGERQVDRGQLRAADAERAVVHARVDVGQHLVLVVLDVHVALLEAVFCRHQVRPLAERVAHGLVDVDRLLREGRLVGRLEFHRPEVGSARVEDERAQVVLRLLDVGVGDDDALVVARDLGLRLDDVDWRHGADLDALLVVLERLLRQRQRLLLRLQVVDRVDQIPVRVLHVTHRAGDHAAQLDVGEVAHLLAVLHLLPNLVEREVAQQRLRVVDVQRRLELRAEVVQDVGRCQALVVPVRRVAAAPWQHLVQSDTGREGAVLETRQDGALRRLAVRVLVEARREVRRPERARLPDADVLDLRIDPLDADAQVLLEREPRRVVDGEPAHRGGGLHRGSACRRLQRVGQRGLSALTESGH